MRRVMFLFAISHVASLDWLLGLERKVYGSEDAVDLVSFELRRSKFFTFCRSLDRLLPCCCCYKSDRNPSKIEACALQNHSPQREIRNCIFQQAMRISMRIIICGESCCD
jgi:hypothetical protein